MAVDLLPTDANCRRCDLWNGARHVCIPGRDQVWSTPTRASRVMIVGEAPGYNEDVSGQVLVGASGKLLDRAMKQVGLEWAYLTNTVRCFPNGKLPKTSVGLCAPYLEQEIKDQAPEFILALGATAYQRLGGKGAITEAAGKEVWSERYDCWIMPALHPAAVLRSPAREESWLSDLQRFATLVRQGPQKLPIIPIYTVTAPENLHTLRELIHSGRPFTYDFEATPIPIWHKHWKAYSVAFYFARDENYPHLSSECAWVLPLYHPESPWSVAEHGPYDASGALLQFFRDVKDVMQDPTRIKVTHNDLYDAQAWQRCAGYYPHTTCDTMALAHLLDENRPKSLKWLGRSILGWPDWDIDAKQEHPLAELAKYNAYDAVATWELYKRFTAELKEDPHQYQYFAQLVMPSIRAVGRMMSRGIYVDRATLDERIATCQQNIVTARAAVPVENPGSSQQVAKWLYEDLKLPILTLTPGGKPSTDESTIQTLAMEHPEVRTVLEYRKWAKVDSTYLAPALELVSTSHDGRAHFDYRSTSVETGRWGSRFHTQPRGDFVRSIFAAPSGRTLLSADFSQIEARLAAWRAAGRPTTWEEVDPERGRMLLAFHEGRDIYVETAAAALNKRTDEVTTVGETSERQMMGKVPSLAMIYRISAEGFRQYAWNQFQVLYTVAQAEHLHRTFYNTWPEIREWHQFEERLIRARGYADNPLGRRRHLPEVESPDRKIQAEAVRSGLNAPIQGCASNVLDAAVIILQRDIDRDDWDAGIVGIVHDDLVSECARDLLPRWAVHVKHTMTVTVPRALRALDLYLPEGLLEVEAKAGPWSSASAVKI